MDESTPEIPSTTKPFVGKHLEIEGRRESFANLLQTELAPFVKNWLSADAEGGANCKQAIARRRRFLLDSGSPRDAKMARGSIRGIDFEVGAQKKVHPRVDCAPPMHLDGRKSQELRVGGLVIHVVDYGAKFRLTAEARRV